MCYTVGSKLLKEVCCDSVLKPSEAWKVPPNNPVSMQLSALQKLEVVSHADCRACLFTSLSIQMIDGLFFLKRLSRMRLDMTFCTYDVLCHNVALLF